MVVKNPMQPKSSIQKSVCALFSCVCIGLVMLMIGGGRVMLRPRPVATQQPIAVVFS